MLYWKDTIDVESCTICGESRWKLDEYSGKRVSSSLKKKKIPVKYLRHFPIIPRLQKLFMSSKTSDLMRWHAEERTDDGILRHLADSEAWKSFDSNYPSFSEDCRNIRFGL